MMNMINIVLQYHIRYIYHKIVLFCSLQYYIHYIYYENVLFGSLEM